jgi:hypothetical protein
MRASRGWQLAVPVEDRFDVVPVRVDDERCVIPGVVMRAKTRRAVVAAAGFDSGAVELVNGGSVGCGEGHMNGSGRRFPFPDPEISTALDGEPRPLRALHYLHSERLEGLLVEGAAASQVTYSQGQVVDEGKRHGSDTPSILERDLRGTFLNTGAGERLAFRASSPRQRPSAVSVESASSATLILHPLTEASGALAFGLSAGGFRRASE